MFGKKTTCLQTLPVDLKLSDNPITVSCGALDTLILLRVLTIICSASSSNPLFYLFACHWSMGTALLHAHVITIFTGDGIFRQAVDIGTFRYPNNTGVTAPNAHSLHVPRTSGSKQSHQVTCHTDPVEVLYP